jgi:DNA-binding transcriptional MocR family regulator
MNHRSRDAWPSVRRLASDTNRNPGTVWRSLRRLEERKLIFVIHGRGPRKPNRYRPGLGELGINAQKLRRPRRGNVCESADILSVNLQRNVCEPAYRTLKEPRTKSRKEVSQEKPTLTLIKRSRAVI